MDKKSSEYIFGAGYYGGKRYTPRGLSPWERVLYYGWRITDRGCWEYLGSHTHQPGYNYGVLVVSGGKDLLTHRVSYEYHHGPIAEGLVIRHKCDNPPCINPGHLEVGTMRDNALDRELRGRRAAPSGERHGMNKLSEDQVRQIRKRLELGETQTSIAADFGITRQNVRRIKLRETWEFLA